MKRTIAASHPVISFLSPSLDASLRAQELLCSLFQMERIPLSSAQDDSLDGAFHSSIPGLSQRWSSVASKCQSTGFHFLSTESFSGSSRKTQFSLLGITDTGSDSVEKEILSFRASLGTQIDSNAVLALRLKTILGRQLGAADLLRNTATGGLPMLVIPNSLKEEPLDAPQGLKEIAIPFFDRATYADGASLHSKLGDAGLKRPTVGLYEWPQSTVHLRPLPMAAEDQTMPPPTLVFHHDAPEAAKVRKLGVSAAKIGYSGHRKGQLMLVHSDLSGLDLRYCSSEEFSSSFSEAQESLFAGSLEELQSSNALLAGGESAIDDVKTGNADCWVEVRANLKRPYGFWNRYYTRANQSSNRRSAKIPYLPYE